MRAVLLAAWLLLSASAIAAIAPRSTLNDRLSQIRSKVLGLESNLINGAKTRAEASAQLKTLQQLIALQKQEREIGKKRLSELEATVSELEIRKGQLAERITVQKESIRKFLISLDRASRAAQTARAFDPKSEQIEAPRRKVLMNLVDRGLKEIEAYKVDLADAEQLSEHIKDERQQIAYLFEDLKEQESVLELNRAMQADYLRRSQEDRVAQLENYHRLKNAESQVAKMIVEFNARRELEKSNETERAVMKSMNQGAFAKLKGRLSLPVAGGRVISSFGRSYDPKSRLQIFKKGVEIAVDPSDQVKVIAPGKVAFSGELPNYGKVTIIDHGDHFYSLCAHLGKLERQAGDAVAVGDVIGSTDDQGTPVYFEIRARNVAVNPLQWVSN